jgi:hypothetical protein
VSALDRPSEVLLVAFFDTDHVATLARESWEAALEAAPRAASLRMPGVGRALARGALAVELSHGPAALGGEGRLGTALRRLGLSVADVPRLALAVRAGLIPQLVAVPHEEAPGWGRPLQGGGAVSLTARPRLTRWPPAPKAALGHRLGATPSVALSRRSRRLRREPVEGPWWDGTAS